MIANALNKLYSDQLTTQRNTICSSILKKFYLKNNEKKMLRKEDIKFKSEIHIESNTKTNIINSKNSTSIENNILITSYLSGTSFKSQYEYKLPITDAISHEPSQLLNDEKNTSSYHLNHSKNENLNLKQKFSNKLKEFSTIKSNEIPMLNLFSNNHIKNKNKDDHTDLVYQNSISSNSNSNLSDDDDECCSNCSITNTMNRLSMFDQQELNNLDNVDANNKAVTENRLDQSDDITYSIEDGDNNNQVKTDSKIYEVIDLAIHRLPGENMGIDFSVQKEGFILVEDIIENGAAYRAMQLNGVRLPLRQYDEIIEINNVSLNNMKQAEIISMISELPLYIKLKIRRQESELSLSSNDIFSQKNFSENVPSGYYIYSLFVSSLVSIELSDVEANSDGYFKYKKMTSFNDDSLNNGDIFYKLNEISLIDITKPDLINLLKSINKLSELKLFRKLKSAEPKSINQDDVPYHNGVFAKNSIKLAVRSANYDKTNVIKFNKYNNKSRKKLLDFIANGEELNLKVEPQDVDTEINTANLNDQNRSDLTSKFESDCNKKEDLFCASDQTLTSIHDDNWIFLDRKPSSASSSNCSSIYKNSSQNLAHLDDTNELSNEFFFAKQNESIQASFSTSSSASSFFNEADTIKSLTNSSCHSERSVARLNCLTLYEDNSNEHHQLVECNKQATNSNDAKPNEKNKPDEMTVLPLQTSKPKLHENKQDQQETRPKPESLIVRKFFNRLKSISEEKPCESCKTSQGIRSVNSSNKSIERKNELSDLKRSVHDELVQIISDNKAVNENKIKKRNLPSMNLAPSKDSSPNRLNSLIKKIQNRSGSEEDIEKEIEKKISNFQKPATVLCYVGREPLLNKPTSTQIKPQGCILKNSNDSNKNKDATYVNSALKQENNKKLIINEKPPLNLASINKQNKALSSPSLVEDQKLNLSVKEKIKLFMNQSKSDATNHQLNRKGSFNFRINSSKTEIKPRPLSQVLIESLRLKSNLNLNRVNNLSISTNKLSNKPTTEYARMHSFRCNNQPNKIVEQPLILTANVSENEEENSTMEPNFKSVKDKIAYFTTKSINNSNKNSFLVKKKTIDFRNRH